MHTFSITLSQTLKFPGKCMIKSFFLWGGGGRGGGWGRVVAVKDA